MVLLATNGDPEPALEAGRSRAAAIGDAVFLALAETHLAEVVRRHGETGEAADRLAATATAGDEMGSPFVAQMARLCLALAHADAGDLELAATELQHAASEATATFMTPFATTSRILLAHVLVATGHQENATTAAEEAIALARANGYRIFEADALTALAATQLRAGDTEGAEAVAHDALRGHLGFDSLLATADDLDLLAGVAAALTSDAEAIRLHAAAEAIRDRLGARLWRFDALAVDALLDAAAARLGIDDASSATAEGAAMDSSAAAAYATRGRGQRRRPATGWPSLTPTELDVVRLAAKGLTNPQIAEQLFVERSTVKSHLSSIFAKLGVTTRAELAALATRRGL
jgi:DNA-binding NarL/FixJ family response regulator